MRVVLAAYLVVMQLAGPLACCCAASRLPTPVSAGDRTGERQPAPTSPCCQHRTPVNPKSDAPSQAPAPPTSPDRPRCPCQQAPVRAVFVVSADAHKLFQRQVSHERVPTVAILAIDPLGHPHGQGTIDSGDRLPFLTTADLLHLLHILRC